MSIERFKEIYGGSFEQSEPFDTALFEAFGETIESLRIDGKIVSMLFKIPCRLKREGECQEVYYIYAAATDTAFREKGYMERLLKRLMAENKALFLKSANQKLCKYYEKLGFRQITAKATAKAQIEVDEKQKQLSKFCDSCPEKFNIMVFGDEFNNLNEVSFSYPME